MKETPLTAEEALALLRQSASRLAALTDGLPPERLHAAPQPDEWSPNDVLAHVRACCDVWGGNISRILADEHPTFAGMNPRTWMKQIDYPQWPFEEALRAFSVQRRELLSTLDALPPGDWERTATVTSYGQPTSGRCARTRRNWQSTNARTCDRSSAR